MTRELAILEAEISYEEWLDLIWEEWELFA